VRVLGVDTTTGHGSVALVDADKLVGEVHMRADQGHSRWLLGAIDLLLQSAGLTIGGIDGFGVAVGPGSFTGLRVGLATVQGLAEGAGKKCVGVATLDALAARLFDGSRPVAPMLDAYREQVFAAVYSGPGQVLVPPTAAAPLRFLEHVPEGGAFGGEGAARYRDLIAAARPDLRFVAGATFVAGEVARLASEALRQGRGVDPAALRPVYLRDAEIRKPRA
jgi:tRNA threonylcarbamoyladenosine biosynthesis protein TsaB